MELDDLKKASDDLKKALREFKFKKKAKPIYTSVMNLFIELVCESDDFDLTEELNSQFGKFLLDVLYGCYIVKEEK